MNTAPCNPILTKTKTKILKFKNSNLRKKDLEIYLLATPPLTLALIHLAFYQKARFMNGGWMDECRWTPDISSADTVNHLRWHADSGSVLS